ncbi:unnamed protein product [Didymodactylos carnosus]|uniref:Polycystin cation channel PKD1/PKD2 domain-containing protein n=1 Tax=Didymodactylos carnosus TaxID=1234261 RepID=A0A814U8C9_9BILA|nr:unnamed protein product [Didymodactylos carnosus]CAF1170950.1 unnamed protein product [Didymodactylos carnosus]CAF3688362.1 unnamed protein product [Didymodactylos carnosus]CAF3934745.1 unnamed protein product [Didymodactylos carnosus]
MLSVYDVYSFKIRRGGYVYEFCGEISNIISNLTMLKELSWIDGQTRAILIQFSMYNANVNLFIFVTLMVEFLPTGGIFPQAKFEAINLLVKYTSEYGMFQFICFIIYMLFVVYYTIIEIRLLIQLKWTYFKRFWSYIEWGIIICSWTALGIYIARALEQRRIETYFKQNTYINLHKAFYIHDLLIDLIAFCAFFSTIKLLCLLQVNHRISILSRTLEMAAKDLILFGSMFSVIFVAFLCLFFLLFSTALFECSSTLRTAQMLFEMMLLKFDVSDLVNVHPTIGPLVFSLYIVFVVFIIINMFISIINDKFKVVKHDPIYQIADNDIIKYMVKKFRLWTGKFMYK